MLDYHILYFLPALIVYGIWTWYTLNNKNNWMNLYVFIGLNCFIAFFMAMVGIKYFTN